MTACPYCKQPVVTGPDGGTMCACGALLPGTLGSARAWLQTIRQALADYEQLAAATGRPQLQRHAPHGMPQWTAADDNLFDSAYRRWLHDGRPA